jgi:hypothetical protein
VWATLAALLLVKVKQIIRTAALLVRRMTPTLMQKRKQQQLL